MPCSCGWIEKIKRLLFKKDHRLLTPRDYQYVFKFGDKQRSGRFVFVCYRNTLPYARLGLAVAKRVIPKAVHRNHVRRVIRESFRHHQEKLAGWDVVVMAGASLPFNLSMLHEDLRRQWARLLTTPRALC